MKMMKSILCGLVLAFLAVGCAADMDGSQTGQDQATAAPSDTALQTSALNRDEDQGAQAEATSSCTNPPSCRIACICDENDCKKIPGETPQHCAALYGECIYDLCLHY